MDLDKVILYYGFAPIVDTDAVKLWQKTLCESLGIKGRIIVSPHGINGTLGGKMEDLKKYVKATKAYPGFKKIDFKWSDGTGNDFPKLKIKIRPELVAFGNPDEIIPVLNNRSRVRPLLWSLIRWLEEAGSHFSVGPDIAPALERGRS